ncbi:MAG: hypothetical protein GF384_06685 [Elusimicrobia bacterium]|nr:hypothetical protein [Elusimicrobiota bacterium]MBD3412390.1 hypothetical protein [Elusimicrobiota bacterium]
MKIAAEYTGNYDVGPRIKTFVFKPLEKFSFRAGQWGFFEFDYQGSLCSKIFSFSSSPARENIEMTTMMSGSNYKQALQRVAIGHRVSIRGPFGNFTLDALHKESACFLVGGIGITPVKSMLELCVDAGEKLHATVLYSNKNAARIIFKDQLDACSRKIPSVRVIHTLTQICDEEQQSWCGETGYIDADKITKYCSNCSDQQFYVVGPPGFTAAMVDTLTQKLSIERSCIMLEKFSGY